ncbi:hypothetical protein BC828DRAFT_377676 [Blastocladiella britannica]|nr:hypothetical protein BC828DRAFT_377676 [Blastocladiella britannica]
MSSFLGFKLYPAPILRPYKWFFVGGAITWTLMYKARAAMLASGRMIFFILNDQLSLRAD